MPAQPVDDVRYVSDYRVEERVIDQAGARYEVRLELVAAGNKTPQQSYTASPTRASDEGEFAFATEPIVTKRVNHQLQSASTEAVAHRTFRLLLGPAQVQRAEEALRHLEAATVRQVPDGPNTVDDNSPNAVNTVTITPPDNTTDVQQGDYVATNWETDWFDDTIYEVVLSTLQV